MSIIIFVIILAVLILVHEFGHFCLQSYLKFELMSLVSDIHLVLTLFTWKEQGLPLIGFHLVVL